MQGVFERLIARARARTDLPPPLAEADLARVESALGFGLNPLLRRFYLEVANGSLFGVFGVRTEGNLVDDDSSLLDVRAELFNPKDDAPFLGHAVPFADLGCAQWLWVDGDGAVISMIEGVLYRAPVNFEEWFEAALAGRDSEVIFAPGPSRYGRNPFTGEKIEFKTTLPRGVRLTRGEQ